MVKKNLITTRLKVKKNNNLSDLFLGQWAVDYDHECLDNDIQNYHWDNRKLLHEDYLKVEKIYESFLPVLSDSLNRIHNVKKSERYWRILVGPWLGIWLQVIMDRWNSIMSLKDLDYKIETTFADHKNYDLSPIDTDSFLSMTSSDEFNHILYSKIIKFTGFIKYHSCKDTIIGKDALPHKKNYVKKIRYFFKNLVCNIVNLACYKNKVVFIDSYLSLKDRLILELSLYQLPSLLKNKVVIKYSKHNKNFRQDLDLLYEPQSKFEEFALAQLPEMIPRIFVEDYFETNKRIKKLIWPKSPKVIVAAVLIQNDHTKFWVSEKVENGSKLIIEQHGGNYGMGEFSFNESHELRVSDIYLSWGWQNDELKIRNIAHPKLKSKLKSSIDGGIYQILMSLPRYSYRIYSVPIASQVYEYENDQVLFSKSLNNELQKKLKVRLHSNLRGYDQAKRFKDMAPKINLTDTKKNIYEDITQNRITVCTYNATTILECIAANIPTVMFWNPNHWELNKYSKPYFEALKKVDVLHDDPILAAKFINKNWDNIEDWWHMKETQEVLLQFRNKYALSKKNWKTDWIDAIKELR